MNAFCMFLNVPLSHMCLRERTLRVFWAVSWLLHLRRSDRFLSRCFHNLLPKGTFKPHFVYFLDDTSIDPRFIKCGIAAVQVPRMTQTDSISQRANADLTPPFVARHQVRRHVKRPLSFVSS